MPQLQFSKVNNAIITLTDTDDLTKGKHFKSRFIQPGLAGYPGQFGNALIKKENLDRFVHTLRNKPVTINHKDKITEEDKKGEVFNVWFNPDDGWYWCDGIIFDDEAINLINNGWSVSCAYDFTKADNSGGTENNIPYDIEFLDGEFNHLALVDNPRYEGANIVFNSKVENEDKWITIKPNGEDAKGKHLLLKDGETPKEAIERTYKKNENQEEKNNDFDIKKHLEEVRKNHKNFSDETSDYLNDLKTNDKTAYKEVMALVKKYFTTVKYLDKKGLLGKKEEIDRIPDYLNSDLKYTPEGEKLREFAKKHGKTYGNLIKTIYELQKKKSQAQNSLTDTILNAIAEIIIGD